MKTELFPEKQPVSALDVCRRLPFLKSPTERRLVWFLHSFSMEPGGLERMVNELVDWFPGILQTETMAMLGKVTGGVYTQDQAEDILADFGSHKRDGEVPRKIIPEAERSVSYFREKCQCGWSRNQMARLLHQFCRGDEYLYWDSELRAYAGLGEALLLYERRKSAEAAASFYQTNIGREVWKTLDWCLETRRPCVIEGQSGRGKSTALRAYAAAHRGEVRVFTVPGYGCQRDVFHALAAALGIPHANKKAANEIRFPLEDALRRSGLALFIDEAHHLLSHRSGDGRPPLIDWVDSALVDKGIPVALCVTPQFALDLAKIERRSGWNAEQFRRRFAGRWETLPKSTAKEDLEALALRLMPQVGRSGIRAAVEYAEGVRDVSGLGDLAFAAQRRASLAGHTHASFEDLKAAVKLDRLPSDNAMEAAFARPGPPPPPPWKRNKRGNNAVPAGVSPESCEPIAEPLQVSRRSPAVGDFQRSGAPLLVSAIA